MLSDVDCSPRFLSVLIEKIKEQICWICPLKGNQPATQSACVLMCILDLVNSIAGCVDGAQLLQVVSGVTQTSEGLEHLLHSRVGSLCGQLLWVCTT